METSFIHLFVELLPQQPDAQMDNAALRKDIAVLFLVLMDNIVWWSMEFLPLLLMTKLFDLIAMVHKEIGVTCLAMMFASMEITFAIALRMEAAIQD